MFQDEAGFGRINKPKYCWGEKGIRPSVPCHHIRECMVQLNRLQVKAVLLLCHIAIPKV